MRKIWPELAKGWRSVLAVLAIYALVLHGIFGAAALGASFMRGGDGQSVICQSDFGPVHAGKDAGKLHSGDCRCLAVCAQQGFAGIEPSGHGARWLVPRRFGQAVEAVSMALPGRGAEARAGHARAPPHLGSSFA